MQRGIGLRYIDENPVAKAYQRGTEFATQQALAEGQIANQQLQFTTEAAAAPGRLRSINAGADLNESQARVAGATEQDKITQSGQQTQQNRIGIEQSEQNLEQDKLLFPETLKGEQLGNQRSQQVITHEDQMQPGRVQGQALQNEGQGIQNRQGEQNLNQDAQMFQPQLDAAKSNAEAARINQETAEIKLQKEQAWKEDQFLDMALQDPGAAILWAQQNGMELSPEQEAFVQDRQLVALAAGVRDRLKEQYPGDENILVRDREFDRIMEVMMKDDSPTLGEAEGLITQSTETPVVPAPKGSSGRPSVFEQKRAAYLSLYPNDAQGALDYASGLKRLTAEETWQAAVEMAQDLLKQDLNFGMMDQASKEEALQNTAKGLYETLIAVPGQTPPAPSGAATGTTPGAAPQAPQATTPAPQPQAQQQPAGPTAFPKPSVAAINHLRQNPTLAPQFDQKFGPGAAQQYLQIGR